MFNWRNYILGEISLLYYMEEELLSKDLKVILTMFSYKANG